MAREVVGWYTWNGRHYPIFEGESKSDAHNRVVAKNNEDTKERQISKSKEQADKLNGKAVIKHEHPSSKQTDNAKRDEEERKQRAKEERDKIKSKDDMAQFMYGESYDKLGEGLKKNVDKGYSEVLAEREKPSEETKQKMKNAIKNVSNSSKIKDMADDKKVKYVTGHEDEDRYRPPIRVNKEENKYTNWGMNYLKKHGVPKQYN